VNGLFVFIRDKIIIRFGLVSSGQHLKISTSHLANMLISYLSHTWLILLL